MILGRYRGCWLALPKLGVIAYPRKNHHSNKKTQLNPQLEWMQLPNDFIAASSGNRTHDQKH